jgi:hypothetical protein
LATISAFTASRASPLDAVERLSIEVADFPLIDLFLLAPWRWPVSTFSGLISEC